MAGGPAASFLQIVKPLLLELEVGIRLLSAYLQPCDLDCQLLLPCLLADHKAARFDNTLLLARHFVDRLLQQVGNLRAALIEQRRLRLQPGQLFGGSGHLSLNGLFLTLTFSELLLRLLQPALVLQITTVNLLQPPQKKLAVSIQLAELIIQAGFQAEETVHLRRLLLMQPGHLAEFVSPRPVLLLHGMQFCMPAFAACLSISGGGIELHQSPHWHP